MDNNAPIIPNTDMLDNAELLMSLNEQYKCNKCSLVLAPAEYIKSRHRYKSSIMSYIHYKDVANCTHNKVKCNPIIASKYLHKKTWQTGTITPINNDIYILKDVELSNKRTPYEICDSIFSPNNMAAKIHILSIFEDNIVNMFNSHKSSFYIELVQFPHTQEVVEYLKSIGYNISQCDSHGNLVRYTVSITD